MLQLVLPLALLVGPASAGQEQRPMRQLPPPTDIDPQLTEHFRRLEQNLADAILRKDAEALDRLVSPQYTLRVSDVPQGSLPRAIWMQDSLHRLNAESVELQDCAARKLAEDVAVVSLLHKQKATTDGRNFSGHFYLVDFWKKSDGNWQILARYSSPVGQEVDRGSQPLPPPADVDPQLTEVLRQLEQQLAETAVQGFKDTRLMERLVGSEFTLRMSDAPQMSVPRPLWGQPSSTYKVESFQERYHAARKLADDLAVVSLLLTQKASSDGRDRSGDFYVVDIWKRRGDRWQVIARYSCPVGKTFDRRPR